MIGRILCFFWLHDWKTKDHGVAFRWDRCSRCSESRAVRN